MRVHVRACMGVCVHACMCVRACVRACVCVRGWVGVRAGLNVQNIVRVTMQVRQRVELGKVLTADRHHSQGTCATTPKAAPPPSSQWGGGLKAARGLATHREQSTAHPDIPPNRRPCCQSFPFPPLPHLSPMAANQLRSPLVMRHNCVSRSLLPRAEAWGIKVPSLEPGQAEKLRTV